MIAFLTTAFWKIYDNRLGRRLLLIQVLQLLLSVLTLLFDYWNCFLLDGNFFLFHIFNQLKEIWGSSPIIATPTQNMMSHFILTSLMFFIVIVGLKHVVRISGVDFISYDEEAREIKFVGEKHSIVLPTKLLRLSALSSYFQVIFVHLLMFQYWIYPNELTWAEFWLGNTLVLTVCTTGLQYIELYEWGQFLSIEQIFKNLSDHYRVIDIFEQYLENRDVVVHYLDIDLYVRQFFDFGIFQTPFGINFLKRNSDSYRIDISEKFLEKYIKCSEEYLNTLDKED